MTKTAILIACAAILGVIAGCAKKPSPQTQEKMVTSAAAVKTPFAPPGDSAVTTRQISSWLLCNPLLDSLAYFYADSFKAPEPAIRLRLQGDFTEAQDVLCVRAGLSGGYEEYLWIRTHMGNPKNKGRLDTLGVGVY